MLTMFTGRLVPMSAGSGNSMHSWGDDGVDWEGINAAADYIGVWLRKWGRVNVRQIKEKFGTVRIYCTLGWNRFHDIFYPGHCFFRWPGWAVTLDLFISHQLCFSRVLFEVSYPIQRRLYRWRYTKAVEKWPHLREEILSCADWPDELKGL
jgi:hypothetical protein